MSIERSAEDIIQVTAEEIRDFKGDVDWDKINATTEEDIVRQALEDGDTTDIDMSPITRHRGETCYRELRERLGGLSHAEFARPLGVDEQTVVAWERSFEAPEVRPRYSYRSLNANRRRLRAHWRNASRDEVKKAAPKKRSDYFRAYQANRRANGARAGMCIECATVPRQGDSTRCAGCLERARESMRAKRA